MLRGLIAQRLVRRNCPTCNQDHVITDEESQLLSGQIATGTVVKKGTGCSECNGTGFKGRLPIYEVIEVDPALERLIHKGMAEAELIAAARQNAPSILLDGIAKLKQGLTTPQDVARAVQEDILDTPKDEGAP